MKQPCLYCGETRAEPKERARQRTPKELLQLFSDYLEVALAGISTRLEQIERRLAPRDKTNAAADDLAIEVASLRDDLGRIEAHLGRLGIEIPQKRVQSARKHQSRSGGKTATKRTARKKATVKT